LNVLEFFSVELEALAEYRIAFGNDWQLRIKKERENNG